MGKNMVGLDSLRGLKAPDILRRLLAGWVLAVLIEYLLVPGALRDLDEVRILTYLSLLRVLVLTVLFAAFLTGLSFRFRTAVVERWLMFCSVAVYLLVALLSSFHWFFLIFCTAVMALLLVYALKGWNEKEPKLRNGYPKAAIYVWIVVGLSAGLFLFLCVWGILRVVGFVSSTYDFTIFAQMFHNMSKTGLPLTTVERDTLMSHFHVHVSPIFYLLLPFYMMAPYAETLPVLQAAVMVSAVIPMWKLAKHHGLLGWQCVLMCAVLVFYPAFAGGAYYDIHENCFLMPLILWLLYALDKKHTLLIAVSSLLLLMVKEDAAIYLAVAALWYLLRGILHPGIDRKYRVITGCAMLAGAIAWFVAATSYLSAVGDGVMTYRYGNLMTEPDGSLLSVIGAVIVCPVKVLFECADKEKWEYLLLTMLPLLGLPLMTRRYERLLLLIPYLLINLISDYKYQHNIMFQYNFGSAAFLLYLMLVNLSVWKIRWNQSVALLCAVLLCMGSFVSEIVPSMVSRINWHQAQSSRNNDLRTCLDTIPDDASVIATGFLTPYFYRHDVLYDLNYTSVEHVLAADYVVIDLHDDSVKEKFATKEFDNGFDYLNDYLLRSGFDIACEIRDSLIIYSHQ